VYVHVVKKTSLRIALVLVCVGLPLAAGCTNFVANRSNADGVALFQRGQYQEALAQFQAATYADPGNADGYYNLGATYHRLGRLRTEKNDYLAQAEKNYRQCLGLNNNHRDCHRGLAVLLIEENRANEAFASIQTWAAQSPSLPEPRMELARLYEEFGNKEAAANTLAEAVRLNPDDPRQWAAMGKVREEMGDNNQALTDYQHSLAINPNQSDVTARVASLQASLAHQPLALPPPPGAAPGTAPGLAPSNTPSPVLAGQPPPANR
jgi:tetratricopeptide (TPR) repeat protein